MKFITAKLKDKVSDISVSYVIEGEVKADKTNEAKLISGRVVAQNDLIYLDFSAEHNDTIGVTSEELRALAKELNEWADLTEETI